MPTPPLSPVRRSSRYVGWLIVAGAAAYLCYGFLVGTPRDEEEYRISILTTLLHARAIANGAYPFWTSELGLGQPHPLGQSFTLHPLMPLLAWMKPDRWANLLQVAQVAALVGGGIALGARLKLLWLPTAVMVATLLLAAPTENYVLTDFWPSGLFGWSLMPAVVAALVGLTEAESRYDLAFFALVAGLLGGFVLGNGHPGYSMIYAVPLAAFLAMHASVVIRRWIWWALAGLVALAIASPILIHVGAETLRFPAGLPRLNYGEPLRGRELWDLFMRPFPIGAAGGVASGGVMDIIRARGARVPFFGAPFAWLACAAVFLAVWRPRRTDVLAGFGVSFLLLSTPGLSALKIFPATYLFRDPLILFGTILAALMLDRLLRMGYRSLASGLMLAQLAALAIAAWPFVEATLAPEPPPRVVRTFADGGPLSSRLQLVVARQPGRIYYSTLVDARVNTGAFFPDGLWRNSLAYRGLRLVNGTFKGVSTDEVWPSPSLPYGFIGAPAALQLSEGTMAVLGIRYVLAAGGEPVAESLMLVETLTPLDGGTLRLYENPDVSGATLVEPQALAASLRRLPDCPESALLCRDLSSLWAGRLPDRAHVEGRDGRLTLRVSPAAATRAAIIAEMYRPGWSARAGGVRVPVREAAGGLMAVDVPAGVEQIDLTYRPIVRILATLICACALVGVIIALAWLGSSRRRHGPRGATVLVNGA